MFTLTSADDGARSLAQLPFREDGNAKLRDAATRGDSVISTVLKTLIVLAGLYLLVVAATYVLQRKLLYFPDTRRTPPGSLGLAGVSEIALETADGKKVVAWYAAAAPGQPTLLYFHGNAGSLVNRSERIAKYVALGRGMLMMTYRGYGGSTGQPSEKANVADAMLAYQWLRDKGVAASDIIVYGESLGTGIAVQVAARNEVGGVVLDAPYTSIVDVAETIYPMLPSRWLMTDRYETLRHLPGVSAPMLVIHGEADRVIPVAMGRAVAKAARAPVEIVTFPGAGHSDHYLFGSFDAVNAWIDRRRSTQVKQRKAQ